MLVRGMHRDFDTAQEKTLVHRVYTMAMALILVVLLGFGGDAVALVSEAVDADSSALETVSLTEEQSVLRVAPRTRTQTKNENVAWSAPKSSGLQPDAIVAEGQVAFALLNGGRPTAVHPTGPPTGRV